MKHSPLNDAISLDEPLPRSGRRPLRLLDLVEATDGDPVEHVLRQEEQHEAHVLLLGLCQGLSPLEREALLRVTWGQSYSEAARAMGTNVKAIDNALQRARRKLLRRREALSA